MISLKDSMRNNSRDKWNYQDIVFNNEINNAIVVTDNHYDNMMFKEALKTCFYDLQVRFRVLKINNVLIIFIWYCNNHKYEFQL